MLLVALGLARPALGALRLDHRAGARSDGRVKRRRKSTHQELADDDSGSVTQRGAAGSSDVAVAVSRVAESPGVYGALETGPRLAPTVDIDQRELMRRLVQSLARPVGRFAAAFELPMAEVLDLVQASMMQVMRERGLTLADIGRRMDVSERHAKRLLKQLRESFLDAERGYDLPLRVEFALWAQPMSRARLKQVLRDEPGDVDLAVDALLASGRILADGGRTPRLRPSTQVQRLMRDAWLVRIGALNSLLANVGDAVYGRFIDKADTAFARTLNFLVRPEDRPELARFFEEQLVPFMTALDERAHAARRGDPTQGETDGETASVVADAEAFRMSICWAPYDHMTRSVEAREAATRREDGEEDQ